MLIAAEIAVVVAALVIGARLGSVGIGFAGGAGVVALAALGVPVAAADIPFDVIGIIMAVIAAISAMQRAGGMDHLVHLAERLLRRNPRRVTRLAPLVTYFMTLFAGTGHTAFATLPVIVEVAKEGGVRPSRPLSVAVVASQMAITASPISAAVVFVAALLEPHGVGYLQLLAVVIPATLAAVIATSFLAEHLGPELEDDPEYRHRRAAGLVAAPRAAEDYVPAPGARASVRIFLAAIAVVMVYATAISEQVGLIADPALPRNEAIMAIMLAVALAITLIARIPAGEIPGTQVFRSGMSACVCVMGVAWLGTTLVNAHLEAITAGAGDLLRARPWLLAVVLFLAAALLYSQAATAKAMLPAALAIGVSPATAVASFAATSALFVLPTYPTLLAAVEMDDTGSTRLGHYVVDHPFIIPGTVAIALAVAAGFVLGGLIL